MPTLARTREEILAEFRRIDDDAHSYEDWMGVRRQDLLRALPAEDVRPYLAEDADVADWQPDDDPKAQAVAYLAFAIGKAANHRGLSAGRSIDHYKAWFWLMGDDAYDAIDWEAYPNYGAPILRQVCRYLGVDWDTATAHDPAVRPMAEGRACDPDCDEGCDQ